MSVADLIGLSPAAALFVVARIMWSVRGSLHKIELRLVTIETRLGMFNPELEKQK